MPAIVDLGTDSRRGRSRIAGGDFFRLVARQVNLSVRAEIISEPQDKNADFLDRTGASG